jgi:ketosteroid isomerase-like protein
MRRVILVSLVATLAACADLGGASHYTVQDAQGQWEQALQHFDLDSLNRLLSDTYVQTDLRGKVEERSPWLEYFKPFAQAVHAGEAHFNISFSDQRVRVYGSAAIVTGAATFTGNMKGRAVDNHIRFTNVWVKENGAWRLASYQATILEPKK